MFLTGTNVVYNVALTIADRYEDIDRLLYAVRFTSHRSTSATVTVVFSCDLAVRKSKKLLVTCYKLEKYIPLDTRENKELVKLEDQIENNSPVFLAAGFFQINRSNLLQLLNAVTTYFIIVLQLTIQIGLSLLNH
ncbi:hypothetical protein NQ317_003115 [Molorchus minor]|uniref:Gustatory receptor n=1 Tax=Molorchus minor TaxID=1323400 RepID=A0ABQ9JGM1_9CUCU|nr:hypothetical protein NQ317_003115 [Molorchus minor]